MAKIKLKAVLTATLIYEVEEGSGGLLTMKDRCRHDEESMREDPTDFCDSGRVRFTSKVTVVRDEKS